MNDVNETTEMVTAPSNDVKNIAVFTHLAGIIFGFIPALVVWLLKKEESQYLGEQAKEALNFQIAVFLVYIACGILTVIHIGAYLMFPLFVANIVFCVLAAMATNKGETYRYPFTLRLIK